MRRTVGATLALASLLACSESVAQQDQQREAVEVQTQPAGGVANLPYARGRTFNTLDEYLAHLEAQGAVDLPWWREVRPGVYERVTNMPGRPSEVATREELMRRFGFAR